MIKKLLAVTLFCVYSYAAGESLVEATKVVKGEVNPLQEFIGTLNFDAKSTLAAQNSGIVKSINFEVGQKVKKGDVLVQIDADLLNAQIKAAKANLDIAKNQAQNSSKDYERYEKLLASKSITQKEYDDVLLQSNSSSSNVIALDAKVKELEIQKEQKAVKAPFDGIIVEKLINLGEWASSGKDLLKIVNTSKAEITFNIPIENVAGLNANSLYEITIGQTVVKAKLMAAIPSGDKLTRTFPIKFKTNLKEGFFFDAQQAKVFLAKNAKKEAFIVPRDAVIKRFGQNVIFIISDKLQAVMIPVQVVGYINTKIAVEAEGLVEGMNIVSKGNERIFPNSPLKIINK